MGVAKLSLRIARVSPCPEGFFGLLTMTTMMAIMTMLDLDDDDECDDDANDYDVDRDDAN